MDGARRYIIDAHAHGTHLLPALVRAAYRMTSRGQPPDTDLDDLAPAGVDGLVAAAVGDPLVTRWRWPRSPWQALVGQLHRLRRDAVEAGCQLATSAADIAAASAGGGPAVFLGIEGADPIAEDLSRVDQLYDLGVRVIGPVHFADNAFGTISMSWNGSPIGKEVAGGRPPGLTPLGQELVAELNSRDILIDLAHADSATVTGVCEHTRRPVISSHTGAAAVTEFPRYLPDHDIRAIAATDGLIGLWPYSQPGRGVRTLDELARHADHIANLVGVEHLCLGTDMNGVPGLVEGYRGPHDLPRLLQALHRVGLSGTEIDPISGSNIARLLG
jgi:microsomal dipeptidase-like Zn-dependent dipeptidase